MNLGRRRFLLGVSASGVALAGPAGVDPSRPLVPHVSKAIGRIGRLRSANSPLTGMPTGFTDLDSLTSGLQLGDLVIIAGRPSMGKTSLATNIVENAAVGRKIPAAIFSLEIPGSQLAMRMMASLGRINAHKVRTGKFEDDDWPLLTRTVNLLNDAPIYIEDEPAPALAELVSRAIELRNQHAVGLIVIDAIQHLTSGQDRADYAQELTHITQELKVLAQEIGVPLVATLGLPSVIDQRIGHRPVMADLRGCGKTKRNADMVLLVHRDEVYNQHSRLKGYAEIIIGKNNAGTTGEVLLELHADQLRFDDYHFARRKI